MASDIRCANEISHGSRQSTPRTRLENPASRADLVVDAITRAILTGDLPPGSRLVERDVASLLGVSKTPVREALKVLERKGLTTVNAFRGAEVRIVDETLARDVYGVRVLLEPAAVRQSIGLYDEWRSRARTRGTRGGRRRGFERGPRRAVPGEPALSPAALRAVPQPAPAQDARRPPGSGGVDLRRRVAAPLDLGGRVTGAPLDPRRRGGRERRAGRGRGARAHREVPRRPATRRPELATVPLGAEL